MRDPMSRAGPEPRNSVRDDPPRQVQGQSQRIAAECGAGLSRGFSMENSDMHG